MKHFLQPRLWLCLFAFVLAFRASAAPGDTTWVQAQNDVQLDNYNDFDVNVTFPNGSVTYRKIIMVFTLGKYQCAAGTQYCGDWDYTIQNYLMTPTDTFELSRLITPYANASYPRTPFTWKQRYYFDVTDFYPVLKNNAAIRLSYHNYSGGFLGNIRFAFIEGTPPRPVTGVKKLWSGAFNYGDPADPIDNHVAAVNLSAPANTQSAALRFTVTGHGSDNNGCSEFCSKYYQVKQSGTTIAQKQIWKDDCGLNDLYPQSGTWVYNRGNWCPGQQVLPVSYAFNNITGGTNFTADVDFETYTRSGTGTPQYIVSGTAVYYGAFANALDASLEEIIAPSDYEGNFRSNPTCGQPAVRIRNTGSTTITSVTFQYGVVGQSLQTTTITGLSLASMAQQVITLPQPTAFSSLAGSTSAQFVVTIQQVNSSNDAYTLDNTMKTNFTTAPEWPNHFTVVIKSNNAGTETKWRIEDMSGNVIKQRAPTAPQTTYTDPVTSLANGCYKLVVTDDGCDGLYWWANSSTTGTGWIYVQKDDGSYMPLNNGLPAFPSTVSQDFGCGFTQYFRVNNVVTSVPQVDNVVTEATVTPNPFKSDLNINITASKPQTAKISLYDLQGRQLYTKDVKLIAGANSFKLDELAGLAAGTYMAEINTNGQKIIRKLTKQ